MKITSQNTRMFCTGGVAEWSRALHLKSGSPGAIPPPYRYLDLFSLAPSSTSRPRCVNSQLVRLLTSWYSQHFMFYLQNLFNYLQRLQVVTHC